MARIWSNSCCCTAFQSFVESSFESDIILFAVPSFLSKHDRKTLHLAGETQAIRLLSMG